MLKSIIRSVVVNGWSLSLTAVLAVIVVYYFTLIGYNFFPEDFVGTDGDGVCDDLLECFTFGLLNGIRSGGGVGDLLPQVCDRSPVRGVVCVPVWACRVGRVLLIGVSGRGGGGGANTPAPQTRIVGKNETLQKEILIWAVFGAQTFGLLGSRTPPPCSGELWMWVRVRLGTPALLCPPSIFFHCFSCFVLVLQFSSCVCVCVCVLIDMHCLLHYLSERCLASMTLL